MLLKVVSVTITEPLGSVNTYAMLDDGATITLVDVELAQRIGAEGPATSLNLNGLNKAQRDHLSRGVSLQVKGTRQDKSMKI